MDQVIYVLIIIFLVGIIIRFYLAKKESVKELEMAKKEREEYFSFGEGIILYQEKMATKKQEYKDKILDLIKEKGRASNKDIKNYLLVSESSATRYAEELEKEGKIKQTGKVGRNVFYE